MPLPFKVRTLVATVCLSLATTVVSSAAGSFFKPNDVVAFVGGEDMVAAAEHGYLELVLTRAFPDLHLKFRSLAWEGDTVYEQRRDLNYPTVDQQLDQVGATVIVAQFGQAESFDGAAKAQEFSNAYSLLLDRLTANGRRRAIVVTPTIFSKSVLDVPFDVAAANARLKPYEDAIMSDRIMMRTGTRILNLHPLVQLMDTSASAAEKIGIHSEELYLTRDGLHLSDPGHRKLAVAMQLLLMSANDIPEQANIVDHRGALSSPNEEIRAAIVAKNRLWFHYYRPQNWAFLAGDRTNQPSSRDHIDRNKRWFPEELEQFVPLIEKKEQEIARLIGEQPNR